MLNRIATSLKKILQISKLLHDMSDLLPSLGA